MWPSSAGPGVDDSDVAAADDVADGALGGERARVVAYDAAYAGHHFLHRFRGEVELFVEGETSSLDTFATSCVAPANCGQAPGHCHFGCGTVTISANSAPADSAQVRFPPRLPCRSPARSGERTSRPPASRRSRPGWSRSWCNDGRRSGDGIARRRPLSKDILFDFGRRLGRTKVISLDLVAPRRTSRAKAAPSSPRLRRWS